MAHSYNYFNNTMDYINMMTLFFVVKMYVESKETISFNVIDFVVFSCILGMALISLISLFLSFFSKNKGKK